MSDSRDSWDDERLERLLEQALAVEPSPELHARVRARIDSEADRAARRAVFAPWMAVAAAVVAAALGVTLGSRWIGGPSHGVPGRGTAIAGQAPAPVLATTYLAAVAPLPRVSPRQPPSGRAVVRTRATAPVTPGPVLAIAGAHFAPEDREAFLMLLAMSRAGALPPVDALPPVALEPDLTVSAIEIAEIDILPPVTAGEFQGEPQ